MVLKKESRTLIFEVACTWDPCIPERENEKRKKYLELAAQMAKRDKSTTQIYPIVLGCLGAVGRLQEILMSTKLWGPREAWLLLLSMQREALCNGVRIIRRHMLA